MGLTAKLDVLKLGERRRRSPAPAKTADTLTNEDQPKESAVEDVGFPDGVKVWHDCPNAIVDICFVHGLTGNRDSTWTAHGQDTPWPRRLLPDQLQGARLLTYGYDADIVRASVTSTKRLIDHATELLADVTDDRDQAIASNRPLIFVVHSMGGLICKRAVILSRNNPERHLRTLFDSVIGIVFMGTPHRGSWMADWAKIPASALSFVKSTNESLLRILSPSDQLLESVQADFWSMVRSVREDGRMFEVICFYEELPLPAVGSVVVSKTSATQEGYPDRGIHANHSDMVKFSSEDQNGYKKLLAALVRMKNQVSSSLGETHHQQTLASGRKVQTVNSTDRDDSESHYYIPLRRSKAFRFIGRTEKLEELQSKLFDEDGFQTLALVGLGGVGKTQLALQFVDWVKQNRPDHSIFWIPALSSASFERACRGIIDVIGVQSKPESSKESATEMLRGYLNSKLAGKWLLVVDNADDENVLFDHEEQYGVLHYLPSSDSGLTLFTTRSQSVAARVCDAAEQGILQLESMSKEEASVFIERLLDDTSIDIEQDAKLQLIEKLACHPLAIKQAAAFIRRNMTPLPTYLKFLDGTEQDEIDLLSEDFSDGSRYKESDNAVATTLLVSFEQIRQHDADAADILSFLSLVEPQGIPQLLVPGSESKIKFERSIGTLRGFAFLDRHEDQDGETAYEMHRLVHLATKYWVKKQSSTLEVESAAIQRMNDVFPSDDWVNRNRWRKLMPHALKLVLESETPVDSTTAALAYRMADCLISDTRTRDLLSLFQHLSSKIPTAPKDAYVRLKLQEMSGFYLCHSGKIEKAVELLQQVVEEYRKTRAECDEDLFKAQATLASIYRVSSRTQEAIELLERMMAVTENANEFNWRLRDDAQKSLGRALLDDEQFEKAVSVLETNEKIKSKRLAEDDPSRLNTECTLAAAYVAVERFGEAEDILKKVKILATAKRQENQLYSLAAQARLAVVYVKTGQPQEAITLTEHVIDVMKSTHQDDQNDLSGVKRTLAQAYLQIGRIEKSIHIMDKTAAEQKNAKEHNVKKILLSQRLLALALLEGHVNKQDNRAQRAAGILEEAVEIKKAKCPHHNYELGDLEELLTRARRACDDETEPIGTSREQIQSD